MNSSDVIYSVFNENSLNDGFGKGYPLKAKTDEAARVEARDKAVSLGWHEYGIEFYRMADGCHSTIEI